MTATLPPDTADAAEGGGESAQPPPPPDENLVSRRAFPHVKVRKCWEESRVKYAKAAYKQNEQDYRDALQDLCGPNRNVAEADGAPTRDKKFAGPIFTSDFLKLVSFFNNREPRTTCRAGKGLQGKPLADATAALSDRSALECGEKEQDALVIAEGICRNHGYVYNGWDPYRWLPTFKHMKGEVWLDPDCEGDIKAARWIIISCEMYLSDILDDASIPEEYRKALKDKPDAHRNARSFSEEALSVKDSEADYAASKDWDGDGSLKKVSVYKIFSRDGILPGENTKADPFSGMDDAPESGESDGSKPKGAYDHIRPGSPHAILRPPPEAPDDAAPTARMFDPMEHGRRVYIFMVAGFDKILKVTDWPLDHFDRDEFPVVEFRPIAIPGLLHGMNIYRMIRPYMKIINEAIEFWIASEKRGAKRITEAEDGIEPTELAKLESDNLYEVMKVPRLGMLKVTEFAGRMTSFKELIPFMVKMHDDTTGINEAVSGRAPNVEETASAAKMRQDQAVAAISYLENAVDAYHEKKARMRVACLQRYVPAQTVYAPCPECGGMGATLGEDGFPEPCMDCRGTGRGRILKKGADFWLSAEMAAAWRDDLSLDEIRAEVIVGVEPGSSRTDWTERQLAIVTSIADRYVPLYSQMGLAGKMQAVIDAHIRASGVSNPESLIATLDELDGAIQAQQQAAAANAQKPGKSPEEIQSDIATAQHEALMREREVALEERKAQADVSLRSAQVEVQHHQVQAQVYQAQLQADTQRKQQEQQAAMKQAESAKAPDVDPLKAAEFDHKSATEQERLGMEREKHDMELRKAEVEMAGPAAEADTQTNVAEVLAQTAAVAAEMKATAASLSSAAQAIAAKVADNSPQEAMAALMRIETALAADKTIDLGNGRVVKVKVG